MSNQPTPTFSQQQAPEEKDSVIQTPDTLIQALRGLDAVGYPGLFHNGEPTPATRASFYLSKVGEVVVVAPTAKGTPSQLAIAAAAISMGNVSGGVIAYNTSFSRGRNGGEEGLIPGVYGLVLLCGERGAVDDLARRIAEDNETGAANARRTRASAAPVAAATPAPAAPAPAAPAPVAPAPF